MRVDAVKVAFPSRRVTNEEILGLVRRHSEATFAGDLDRAVERIGSLLQRSGAKSRHWLAADETPIGLITGVVREALDDVGCDEHEIDLLIYTGVDRGFVEPANAYFVANAVGMERVHCFDVLDACNGWSRALLLTYALFRTGIYRRVMLVSSEFPLFPGGAVYPDLFRLRTSRDVKRSFAGFTLGEAATATVLSCDPTRDWEFRFSSRADLAGLCTVPLPGYTRYSTSSYHLAQNGLMRFSSNGGRMFAESVGEIRKLFHDLSVRIEEVAAVFPHAATLPGWVDGGKEIGISELIYNIYPQCGNLASASVPTGIALATEEARIRRGDRLLCLTGSAGMSFAAYTFVF